MDDTTTSRRGRPPAPTPTMPLFLGAARTRVKEEVVMSASTARELRGYVDWAGGRAMMPDDEALIRTIDHALTEYFKNDKAWQIERGDFLGSAPTPSKSPPAKPESNAAAPSAGKPEVRPGVAPAAGAGRAG